jgi:hypothetical protein
MKKKYPTPELETFVVGTSDVITISKYEDQGGGTSGDSNSNESDEYNY